MKRDFIFIANTHNYLDDFSIQKRTNKPLVIILGSWHLRKSSLLRRKLKNYKIIAPVDEKGNILIEPKIKKKKIKFSEIDSK